MMYHPGLMLILLLWVSTFIYIVIEWRKMVMSKEDLMEALAVEIFFTLTGFTKPRYPKDFVIMTDCVKAAKGCLNIISKNDIT